MNPKVVENTEETIENWRQMKQINNYDEVKILENNYR
jgi:hypothetical protein